MSERTDKVINDELDACWALLPNAQPGERLSEAIARALAERSVEPLVRLPDGAFYLLRPSTVRAIYVDEDGDTLIDRGEAHVVNLGQRPVEEVAALLGIPVVEPDTKSLAPMVGAEGGGRPDALPVGNQAEPGPECSTGAAPARASTWHPSVDHDDHPRARAHDGAPDEDA